MASEAQLDLLKLRLTPDSENLPDDDYLESLLDSAESAIMNKRYPFIDWTDLPLESKYYALQIDIAVVLYNRIGAEGEYQHTENGVSRTYQTGGDIPDVLLNRVVPKAKVL